MWNQNNVALPSTSALACLHTGSLAVWAAGGNPRAGACSYLDFIQPLREDLGAVGSLLNDETTFPYYLFCNGDRIRIRTGLRAMPQQSSATSTLLLCSLFAAAGSPHASPDYRPR